jgi:YD repeat-containing protein
LQPSYLYDIASPGHVFDPQAFQLVTADGRIVDITTEQGIVRMRDANDNVVAFLPEPGRGLVPEQGFTSIVHSSGKGIEIDRDDEGRILLIRDPMGHTLQYTARPSTYRVVTARTARREGLLTGT